jgi:MbtH protein
MSNPFDDDEGKFLVLTNPRGDHCLWPTFAPVPPGWTQVTGPDSRPVCLEYIEANWAGPTLGAIKGGTA